MAIQVSTIPAQAPDSVPNGLYADSNLVPLVAGDGIRIVKDIVLVAFEEDATQEQRSVAVSNVGGTVVGGTQTIAGDGIYFVRLPVSGADAVMNAISVLNNLQHVGAASPEIVLDSLAHDYLLPRDSTAVGQWQPNADISTSDANWAFERVAAPLAWGCSTGAAATRIGIVDDGFHDITDLMANTPGIPPIFPDTNSHGTSVASVLGAVGNNNSGMAGMMWRASMRLYNRARFHFGIIPARITTSRDIQLLMDAANDGARAINLSGNAGIEPVQLTPQGSARADSVRRAVVRLLAFEIRRLESRGIEPLFVLAAGNITPERPSANVYVTGYPGIADEFPDRVIVVASSGTGDELLSHSKRGSIVSIAAPGQGVLSLNRRNEIESSSGTSVASPLVTGAAGLLFSFDPRLTAAEVKSLLLLGAARGGRSTATGNYPILNAYEALKVAAERPGAPLCGNRLWAVGDSVYARRGNTTERIAVVPTGVNRVFAFHGGRLLGIQSFNASTSPLFEWQNGVFSVTSRSPQSWESVTGTSQSIFASRSHNGDTTLTVGSGDAALIVNQSPGGALASVTIPAGWTTSVMKCMRRSWDFARSEYACHDSMLISTVQEFNSTSRGAISPQDEVVATVTRMQKRLVEELQDEICPNTSATHPSFCPKFVFELLPLHTTVRILRRSTGTVLHQWQVDGAALAPVTFSEDGSEIAAQEARVNSRSTLQVIGLVGGFGWSLQTALLSETIVSCSNAFYAPHVGSLTLLQPRIDNTAPNACIETLGTNTFGARIARNAPPSVRLTVPPAAPRGKARDKVPSPTRR